MQTATCATLVFVEQL